MDVVIRSVKGERGEDLGTDWEELSFRDLKYPIGVGRRYRFSLDFPDMTKMTEDEKHYDTSVWLAINENPVAPRRSCVVRRCNGNIALVGSPDRSYQNITEARYEPCIQVTELRYMNKYYNQTHLNSTLTTPLLHCLRFLIVNMQVSSSKSHLKYLFQFSCLIPPNLASKTNLCLPSTFSPLKAR